VQGLIKLPDIFGGLIEGKFIYGVVLPGIVIGALFMLPYLDRGPARRWQDRKGMIALGIVVILMWGVLTWMGSPAYKAQASPQEEIALEFVPNDREGLIHEVPFDELQDGTYSTDTYTEGSAGEYLDEFMIELAHAMDDDLPGGVAHLTITTWQRDLQRVDLDQEWVTDGEEQSFSQHTYIHRNTAP
jgi:hypothetical protein